MKLDIPKFRYLAQDEKGTIFSHERKPYIADIHDGWLNDGGYFLIKNTEVRNNKNWRNTLIDLETEDYEFEDGILRRIEK